MAVFKYKHADVTAFTIHTDDIASQYDRFFDFNPEQILFTELKDPCLSVLLV